MNWFIKFLFDWQQLIGSLTGAILAIGGSVWLNHYLTTKAERKRQYSNLLLVLQDIELFISMCEQLLRTKNANAISFNNVVINDKINYIESSQVFDLNPEVYSSIQKIYHVAQVIKYNLENSEATTTIVKKSKNEDIHTEDNVISNRYFRGIAFVEYWLEDVYKNFNFIVKEINKLSKEYNYLSFPETIEGYTQDYVDQKIIEYKLKMGE